MSTRKPHARDRYFRYLARLSRGGRSNMYGAIPYLAAAFGLDRETAFHVICEWIDAQAAAQALAAGPPARPAAMPEPAAAAAPVAPAPTRGRREPARSTSTRSRAPASGTGRKPGTESPPSMPAPRGQQRAARKPAGVKRKRPGIRRAA